MYAVPSTWSRTIDLSMKTNQVSGHSWVGSGGVTSIVFRPASYDTKPMKPPQKGEVDGPQEARRLWTSVSRMVKTS